MRFAHYKQKKLNSATLLWAHVALALTLVMSASSSLLLADDEGNGNTDEASAVENEAKTIEAEDFTLSITKPHAWESKGYTPPHKEGDKLPLVIVLHGAGDAGESYVTTMKPIADEMGFSFLYPNGTVNAGNGKFRWDPQATPPLIESLIDAASEREEIDVNRCLMFGFSNGAATALTCAARLDKKCIGAFACGSPMPPPSIAGAKRLFLLWGKEDSFYKQISRGLAEKIKGMRNASSFVLVEDMAHEVPNGQYLRYGFHYTLFSKRGDEEHTWPRSPVAPESIGLRHILLSHKEARNPRNKRKLKKARKEAEKLFKKMTGKKPKPWSEYLEMSDDEATRESGGTLRAEDFEIYGMDFEVPCLGIPSGKTLILESEWGIHIVHRPAK